MLAVPDSAFVLNLMRVELWERGVSTAHMLDSIGKGNGQRPTEISFVRKVTSILGPQKMEKLRCFPGKIKKEKKKE